MSLVRTWTTAAKPTTASSTATTTWLRRGWSSAARRRSRPLSPRPGVGSSSGMEQVPSDRGDVGEDPDPEHDDHAGRELAAHAELVAEVDDGRGDHHVAEERDHEDLVV